MPTVIGMENGEEILSGIAKHAVQAESVVLRTLGITGDGQADLEAHGGVDKAVYVYPSDHWIWWETEKNLHCAPNTFGENLTLAGADETDICIGDRFEWGDALLEVSQPRAPCFKLGIHTGRRDVPLAMTLSARCGWYLRVIAGGVVPVRRAILRRAATRGGPTVRESFVALFSKTFDGRALRRIHDAPGLSEAWRHAINKKIAAFPG
ncbi:MAG: MOSC domain-containing protein [Alphaproteobacteria bacterium]|nr:MOSC domain-containing protein [Alphaproteobacteria bacterium]MDE2111075.1 MOSC domain-containing protein [Alphaproteobacteria bacterium]MDE2494775.1 MOSC domain-containing protein [Alphaproteobacteria bacterium]